MLDGLSTAVAGTVRAAEECRGNTCVVQSGLFSSSRDLGNDQVFTFISTVVLRNTLQNG